jgi:CheY-like chemotaxis protein
MSFKPKLLPRLLLIEDSDDRIDRFCKWLPEGVVLVVAVSAGRAIGTLQHSRPDDYAGILLDHDLHQQVMHEVEALFSGSNVVDRLIAKISSDVPVLVHSINPGGASNMRRKL